MIIKNKKTAQAHYRFSLIFLAALLIVLFGLVGFSAVKNYYNTSYRLVSIFLIIILFSNIMSKIAVKYLKSYERQNKR